MRILPVQLDCVLPDGVPLFISDRRRGRPVHGPAHGPKFKNPAQLGRPIGSLGGPWAGPFGPFGPQICINYMQDIQYY